MSLPTRRTALGAAIMMLTVVAAGCFEEPLTQEEAEARTETAMSSFAAAMGSRDGGSIKSLDGTMEGTMQDTEFGEDMEAELQIEWGTGDVVYARIEMTSGGFSVKMESWCTPEKTYLKWGGDVYESRPSSSESDEDICRGFDDEEFEEGMMFLDDEELEGLEKGEVTVNDDGTITAVYTDPDENMTMTVTIDRQGRVSRFEMSSPEMAGVFDVTYGSRDSITVPEATERIPAKVWTQDDRDWQTGTQESTIEESPSAPPLDEMEAHWVTYDWDADENDVHATFSLTGGRQTQNGATFEYFDVDGDGHVSVGDRWTFTPGSSDQDQGDEGQIELYDLWASDYANESPLPAPGIVGLLAALGVALVLMRRR